MINYHAFSWGEFLLTIFSGVPNTPRVTEILKGSIQDNQNFTADIKSFDDETLKYLIDIPSVRQKLKDAGICWNW